MNEGHAGFLGAERIRELITDAGLDFDTALAVVRAEHGVHHPHPGARGHRPVPGRDGAALLRRGERRDRIGAAARRTVDRIIALGPEDDPAEFNMAHMGLRLAQRANGVSLLHGVVSRGMFNELWPGFDPPRCRSARSPTACTRRPGPRRSGWSWPASSSATIWWRRRSGWERLQQVAPGDLWWIRETVARASWYPRCVVGSYASWLERGASDAELGWIATAFDPDVLTIGFARRVPTYKRLTLMLRDPDRLGRCCSTRSGRCS